MRLAPDTQDTLGFAVSLVNSSPAASRSGLDEIATVEQLGAFLIGWSYSGRIDNNATELDEVRQTRAAIQSLWRLGIDDAVEAINGMLLESRALPHLARHDGLPWHLHATEPDAPLAQRIEVEVALALVDVIRSGETHRLRLCEADDCSGLLVDLSRNGTKRFCSIRCGNRMNMVAFRDRAAGDHLVRLRTSPSGDRPNRAVSALRAPGPG
ncbi:CGNR zinc finger domain-containing protein [Frigoribacterium sp. CG_9.8]|uniref:CGNR zinc finger domain-containing protein n=1 Tax=Frigoribacterium sp. CG_9.8 TaxID=2787733 RepID=UPI0018CBACD2|nr:CGNR zinc finger domain-containing protein [Frigoribacterium sp. CG_9.8]MBG6107085.1 putative RNA-binding Zn ribbon-like protein [Frigoribacterium sp. CG_9.8]